MINQHIVSSFDTDLEKLQTQVLKMAGLVEAALTDATTALDTNDVDLAEAVIKRDKQIDRIELDLNDDVETIIALRAPMAGDLRLVLSVLKVSASLERIGDYAKNIAKRTRIIENLGVIEGSTKSLKVQSREVAKMLSMVIDAYIRRDADLAQEVIKADLEIDALYNSMVREYLTYMMEDNRHISVCMQLHFIGKNIERMGDLVTNIAEQLIFWIEGERPSEPRPKADITTSDAQVYSQDD